MLPHYKAKLGNTAVDIVQHMQVSLNSVTGFIGKENSVMKQIVDRTTLNSIGDQATAFSIGVNYHSRCHIDHDMYCTLAMVCGPKEVPAEEVICYFIFPAYQIMIPL